MDHDACFVTFGSNTCVVVKQCGHFAVFDPHKRNSQGHVDGKTGKAVVVYHSDYRALYEHLEKLAQQLLPYFRTLEDMPFEVRGVTVRITGDKVQHCDMPTTKEDNVKDSNVNKSQIQRPLYSAVLKGEHTSKRPATCTNSLYEHVTKKKRDSFEVSNSDVQTIANSPQPVSAMNTSHGNDTDKNTDVEITNVSKMSFPYKPLSAVTKGRLCSQMGVRSENTKQLPPQEMPAMGRVCETKSIAGDGNCFFRALSYAISGSENGHMKLRRGIVEHLETLQVDIYTFNADRWNHYPCIHIPGNHQAGNRSAEAIYLNHKDGNHYDVVTCVKDAHNDSICASFDKQGGQDEQSSDGNTKKEHYHADRWSRKRKLKALEETYAAKKEEISQKRKAMSTYLSR
ncbi:uncharacterized protein LOC125887232 [Epinephelus fuscoguttatus]|uniref:uncharacterized protein LOC125887232 n=1 Tax=Epinephelus fuscoguttatus TaxID=293821 RepID=UPI0020D0E0E4|nr:uncharacterized protein LOC125887232 [Epinephelus fuscoguttatus]